LPSQPGRTSVYAELVHRRLFTSSFSSVYPLYVAKAEKKGRTKPLMKKIRYLDKLVDELAKGKSMDKILRA